MTTTYALIASLLLQSAVGELHLRQRNTLEATREWVPTYVNKTQEFDKIAQCFGDCDSSDDCEGGLFCYHRVLDDPFVPGCNANDNPHLDTTNSVCVAELTDQAASSRTRPIRRNLLGMCRGDCDQDSDCNGNLVCLQRDVGDPVPGCSGKNLGTGRDYCVQGQVSNNQGLGLCQGDCDRDSDCSGNLVCKQRDAYDPIPTGCRGRLSWSTDYCVRPSNNNDDRAAVKPQTTTQTTGPFRLKIYWQPGYNWQGEYFERKWCLSRDYNVGGTCWHGLERRTCSSNRVYVTRCSGSSRQQFNFVYVNNDEVLIQIYGQDRCLARNGIHIEVRSCSSSSSSQRFFALRGSLNGYRFELSQKSASRYCLNQDHHPKNGEYVQMFPCSWTRAGDSLTSYWERY